MTVDRKRLVELRMIVLVSVDVTNAELLDALKAASPKPSSVSDVVAAEVVSNLESVSWVEVVIVSHF